MSGRWRKGETAGEAGGADVHGCNKPHALLQVMPSPTLCSLPPSPLPAT